ncbi:uncharacterized protein LOC128127401 [Lactuca sativa]|uniref:uncharacterized protein LOC128127401 n=1 Tax=Lactuca sativa TaxID=4236 RepID=UPI0022AF6824|nr:uncharacterized protein LOC128127401 [Lactuca sativa]
MSQDDVQSNPINISNSIGSSTRVPILYMQDYEVWAHHFEDYVIGSDDKEYLIWEAITLGPFVHFGTNTTVKTQKEYNKWTADVDKIPQDEKDKLLCNVKELIIIRFALQANTFRLVSSCTSSIEICDRLKELYSTDDDLEHSIQTLLLSEFGAFTQKAKETLLQMFDRYNHLLSKMTKHGIERKSIEQKVTFLNSLRPEWMPVVSTVKVHEQFKAYSLAKLMGILKSHEITVSKQAKLVPGVGSLALVSKNKNVIEEEEEDDMSECDLTSNEYGMMVLNPKKLAWKKFPVSKNRNCKNHFAKDCMLKKVAERRESEDDEAYHLRKLEEIKKKKIGAGPMNALIVQEKVVDNEFGGVEVWSTDSEDEEVRRPTHGKAFVARKEDENVTRRCLMVTAGVSTESEPEEPNLHEDKCFAAKPVSEKINDCDHLIQKILDENGKSKIKTETLKSFDSSNAKLMTEHKMNSDSTSKFDDESEMSEISVEDVIDCSEFLKSETKIEKPLISENSVEYIHLSKNKSKKLKEKAVVYQKVQTVPNQVYAVKGVKERQTAELKFLIGQDNAGGCDDFFWSAPIDNADETVGLSEQTSWRVKGRYVPVTSQKHSLKISF